MRRIWVLDGCILERPTSPEVILTVKTPSVGLRYGVDHSISCGLPKIRVKLRAKTASRSWKPYLGNRRW